ncbi:MAG TPA: ArsA-related P-loop ATPase [Acidimicrobiales bacterium]|nr:ArsA-related P-loop ATPase [Acidimicrobiales bacterium]
MTASGTASLGDLLARPVVVCCGPGGVGKTTIAAALALQVARAGRRACVVTVDPARRLADALGVESLPNVPTLVTGDWPGSLHALMLDTKGTFDDLIARYAGSTEQAQAILTNRIYQNLSGLLSGTQEYMAMEKLYELTTSGAYDTVVVDTPPTRNALDLLDAPRRLTRFLENRLFRALLLPTQAYLKAMGMATHALLRTISRVAGAEIVEDAVAFFRAFSGMEEGFRTRAGAVRTLLADPATAYVVVTSPRPDAIEEATYFAAKLSDTGVTAAALVVNRVHPSFAWDPGPSFHPPADGPLAELVGNLEQLNAAARDDERAVAGLAGRVAPAPVGRIALLGSDVHDLAGLQLVADRLFVNRPVS